ncbi:TPA: DNA internalization-related competence protein ComEC/Rec2 [Streptococcus suis]|uniref:DNA internalization-related competence protein ComEC/Rec2 n=1 Tax=Streptococcus suis TaxID=1307 RepID=A0AAP6DW18_STRSU|nr:DNA internalization-related competence protein ComEC/Rec2 [Streptococcus suis]MCB2908174.1 DNA internalization-related competence protein ComEC/Rec2 [Streptococcus suis]MDW8624888.1 DNA internalization-related competence protein ComEC/Rec2 [Streptococcus suis]MDW8632490.1 DNA internalization-related competence protein ComEC/Rec2 [Streptococcus suis]MDW8634919.1 DNA internalization-related competence protein ComEC/Rec2 [Streptococcus suis]MDW8636846.1 DNA internalization-related competence p
MSRLSKLPCQPIHLALLAVAAYFVVHSFSLLTMGLLSLLLLVFGFRQGKTVFIRTLPLIALCGLFFGYQKVQWERADQLAPEQVTTVQVIPDTIEVNGDSLSFRGRADGQTYQVFYKLTSQEEQTYFQKLTGLVQLEVEAEISLPAGQRNFKGFDYQAYLKTQGIYLTVKITAIKKIVPVQSWNVFDWLSNWRRQALVYVKTNFPVPMSHYMTGLLFGDLDSDFDQMSDLYSSLGIIHLFALSGMQVGFFIDKFRWILLRLGLTKETVDKLQIPFSLVYASLTGFSVSVVRSLVQKILGNLGLRKLDNFAVTVFVCLLILPRFLLTAGGVLTFTYAFLLTVFDFEDLGQVKKAAVESLSISLGILPVLMTYFYAFQPLSILLTFAFSFVFDVLLLPGLSVIFLLSPIVKITWVNGFFVFMEKIIVWVADLGLRPWILGKPSELVLLLLLVSLFLLYDFHRRKKWLLGLSLVLALLFFITKHPLENEVTVVDIGQGDSIFLRDMRGRTVLIDVGGRVDFAAKEAWQERSRQANAERTLIPYLHSRGVDRIDSLVLTHTDTDHVGDVLEVAKQVQIGRIVVSPGSLTVPDFVATLKKINVPVHVVKVGDRLPIFDSYLEVLYPDGTGDGGNNDSIVLYGRLLETNFLFTGDLEQGELDLIETYPNLPVDVLKAGHHGSKGSSYPEFLDHIGAKIALVSAGENNRYKHPHQETLERFDSRNIQVYRTDQQGAIRFRGWKEWKIETVRR